LLVVDDCEEYLQFWVAQVEDAVVLTASGPRQALALIRTEQPDAAIVDLHLGAGLGSGFGVIAALRKLRPSLVTVLISADFPRGIEVRVPDHPPDLTASKAVEPKKIWERVQDLLRRGVERDVRAADVASLEDAMDDYMQRVLARCEGNVSMAARQLGISRATIHRRIRTRAAEGE
jgi:two-component system, response regulator RegA